MRQGWEKKVLLMAYNVSLKRRAIKALAKINEPYYSNIKEAIYSRMTQSDGLVAPAHIIHRTYTNNSVIVDRRVHGLYKCTLYKTVMVWEFLLQQLMNWFQFYYSIRNTLKISLCK